MTFTPKTWRDYPSGGTPITAAELDRLERAIREALHLTSADERAAMRALLADFQATLNPTDAAVAALVTSPASSAHHALAATFATQAEAQALQATLGTLEAQVSAQAGWRMVLDLAAQDGWAAVYDPTNPHTRTVVDGRLSQVQDGLGNHPPLAQATAANRPDLAPYEFGALYGMAAPAGGRFMRTGPFTDALPQPNFILTLARDHSPTPAVDTTHFLLDGAGPADQRHAIIVRHYTALAVRRYILWGGREKHTLHYGDSTTQLLGALIGPDPRLWVNGQLADELGPSLDAGDHPMNGLTVGGRYDNDTATWQGSWGPVLIYRGEPPVAVRERMTRLLRTLAMLPTPPPVELTAARAFSADALGRVHYDKDSRTVAAPASTIKALTAYMVRKYVGNTQLDDPVTITSHDGPGANPHFFPALGDVITWRDLLYGMMLASDNVCANALGRAIGERIRATEGSTGPGLARYIEEANAEAQRLGWAGAQVFDASGNDNRSRLSARHLVDLALRINADPELVAIMGTLSHQVSIAGPDPRTVTVTHTIDPAGAVPLPEFVAGKTGTTAPAGACLVMLWDDAHGVRHATALLGSTSAQRFADARRIMDVAGTL